jgi:MHS family alpha-ketoglutarate permease-like MFS transporter
LVKAELFPVEIRALGIGLPHAIAVALFGGSAEYFALWCKQAGHESYFYWYVAACIGASLLLLLLLLPETRRNSCLDSDEC